MRVLQVIRRMNMGGAQMFIMNVYRKIDRTKIQFDFLLNEKGTFDEEIKKLGGKIYYMPYITDIGQRKYGKELRAFFQEHREYKIVHSHINQVSGYIMKIAKESDIPVRIAHSHSTGNLNNFVVKLYKNYLQSMINDNANYYFACSEEAARWLFKKDADKAVILKNGIDIEKFKYSGEKRNKIRTEYNINDDIRVIGHIGRFSKVKNQMFLLNVFNEYHKKNKNTKLLLVGDGELINEVKNKAKEYGIEKDVIFVGQANNTDELYNAMDLFVFPSLYEGIPLTLIEAQTNGLPIIASNNIDKSAKIVESFTFEDLSVIDWNKDIKKLINMKRTENLEAITNSGYDITAQADRITQIYQEFYDNIKAKEKI